MTTPSPPFAPTSNPLPAPISAPIQRFTQPEPPEDTPPPEHSRDESALEPDEDDDYDDYEEDDRPAPKNFLMIAFVVLVALIVPTFIGWIVMQKYPNLVGSQPTRQPASFGATTTPSTGSDMTSQEPVAAPTERRAQPITDTPVGDQPDIVRPQ